MGDPQADDFWRTPADNVLRLLESTRLGLSSEAAIARLAEHGPNQIVESRRRHVLVDLLRRLSNPLVAILLVAAAIAGGTGDVASFVIIVGVILLSTLLDMVQEHRAEATAEALKRSIALTTRALRNGEPIELPVRDIVPGDVLLLAAGDLVPADGLVLEANAAQVNEALLTGEPYPVEKKAEPVTETPLPTASNALYQGTSLIGGTATMLVVKTGSATRFGGIAASLIAAQPSTAFERGIHKLGLLIVRLTIFLVLFVLLARLALGRPPLESFLFAMALAVGLTPELLPMIMTVALARGARRMAAAKVIVKRLSAIHDLGEMDILCTDKTGTLTEACISLASHAGIDGRDSERVARLAAINAQFETGLKSPLDEALIEHVIDRDIATWKKIDERPFDFERRRVSVLVQSAAGRRIEIVKGAPESLLELCHQAEDRSGQIVPLDKSLRSTLKVWEEAQAAQGMRLLAVAWKAADGRDRIEEDADDGLIFLGYCGFVDPPKPSATQAVARLKAAGVRIKVISGDAPAVVEHLVRALDLSVHGLLTGDQIAKLNDTALAVQAQKVDLFARVTPDQKTRIVHALQARGHTVGFIGDGINDAPAIRAADVGVSVAGATDVAREAADMILLASDLNVLVEGVAEGRRTYANIMKYVRMGTSSNFGNMLTMALASLILPFLPLTAVQVLLNNLIYDISQIGIPLDEADPQDVSRPHGWDMPGLVRFTAIMGPLSSIFDLATFALLLLVLKVDVASFRAAWFIESMATQILVIFIIRSARPFWKSRPHPGLIIPALLGLSLAMALPFLPFAGLFGFTAPPLAAITLIAALVLCYLAAAEFLKRFALAPRRHRKVSSK
jgi:Mg2+-importing ATPase